MKSLRAARIDELADSNEPAIMIVYEKFFLKFSQNFLSKALQKKFLIDYNYKTIFESVRIACSSYTVIHESVHVLLSSK